MRVWHKLFVLGLVFSIPLIGMARGNAASEPRYDRFRSRLSGNVVLIPSRCWAEDSMGHLYIRDIADHGAKYTFGCHHKGY